MPALAAFLGTVFSSLGLFLAKLFAVRLAIRVAAVLAFAAIAAVLMNTFNNHVAPLVAQAFSTQYGQFLGLAFPPISGTCIAAYVAVWMACATYRVQARAISVTAGM